MNTQNQIMLDANFVGVKFVGNTYEQALDAFTKYVIKYPVFVADDAYQVETDTTVDAVSELGSVFFTYLCGDCHKNGECNGHEYEWPVSFEAVEFISA